jgi:hypothetical protein
MTAKTSSQNAGILAGVPSSAPLRFAEPRAVLARMRGEFRCITNLAVQFGVDAS